MEINNEILFVEIKKENFIFSSGSFDENYDFNISQKLKIPNHCFKSNKIINLDETYSLVKQSVQNIEKKINVIFKDVNVIIDNIDYTCINISGFKKLNGSQILKENISFILNSIKRLVEENENAKKILHIFNSRSILDGVVTENLPIGLFGDFYNHELTFFLIKKNDYKNIKQIFNKTNLNIKKIYLKNFSDGACLINKYKIKDNFFKLEIKNDSTRIDIFEKESLRYSEQLSFGINMVFKDVFKICSLEKEETQKFLVQNLSENRKLNRDEYLEEEYFKKNKFRKIRKKFIIEIIEARFKEIFDVILYKNINLRSYINNDLLPFVYIEDEILKKNFEAKIKNNISKISKHKIEYINNFDEDFFISNLANLTAFGWKKEAIPVPKTKNSIIARIFKSIFR